MSEISGLHILTASHDGSARVWTTNTAEEVALLKSLKGKLFSAAFAPTGKTIVITGEKKGQVWLQRRPESALGAAVLPEFWLTLLFGLGVAWSVWKDWRGLRSVEEQSNRNTAK